jgi:hypothetical protein
MQSSARTLRSLLRLPIMAFSFIALWLQRPWDRLILHRRSPTSCPNEDLENIHNSRSWSEMYLAPKKKKTFFAVSIPVCHSIQVPAGDILTQIPWVSSRFAGKSRIGEISRSHGGECQEDCHLGCCAAQYCTHRRFRDVLCLHHLGALIIWDVAPRSTIHTDVSEMLCASIIWAPWLFGMLRRVVLYTPTFQRCFVPPSSGCPDDEGSKHLWNVGKLLQDYTA